LDSTELSRYERAQRDYWDLTNILNSAEKKGIKKGRAEGEAKGRAEGEAKGRAEEKISIARGLIKMNMPLTDIANVTGLSIEEIKRIEAE
jgi:predicted transposase/invertase (TIGR01784 family)